ncbi:inositol monophosphatase family protein [Prochlorococcus marinus]|uniref:Inositol-1-monophosphatase n=1 Tax=Prochlorococcus marinus (strain MIT 9211) TaxID=93059 RepID=A9BAD1_PROM4|nr:inositol monophosphatase family protein [Prochlorococcus marinus]ABX08793.1 Possible myo-inositol-1(or 4)-monophosphatase [Prochlorococcus marinus str. MIT 9211]
MTPLICEKAAEDSCLDNSDLYSLLEIGKNAAQQGGELLMKYYGDINSIKNKGRKGDLVTNADIESEQLIIKLLRKETPNIGIYAEESGASGKNTNLKWCIDPLDGTTNFAHGYPFFATSVGLTWNDRPLLGSISVPFFKELYWGCPSIGSFCNNQKNTVSSTKSLIDSLLVTGFAYDRHSEINNNYAEFCWLTHKTRGVRRAGAAAVDMAFVSNGRVDGYWERGLSKWDLAAGVPIVELAGGRVSDYKAEDFDLNNGRIIACNQSIYKELVEELIKVNPFDVNTYSENNLKTNIEGSS